MDVHPIKHVSIGIDPYPIMEELQLACHQVTSICSISNRRLPWPGLQIKQISSSSDGNIGACQQCHSSVNMFNMLPSGKLT